MEGGEKYRGTVPTSLRLEFMECIVSTMQAFDWSIDNILISNFLEIDFAINISDKKSRRFDLSEVIFKCIRVL